MIHSAIENKPILSRFILEEFSNLSDKQDNKTTNINYHYSTNEINSLVAELVDLYVKEPEAVKLIISYIFKKFDRFRRLELFNKLLVEIPNLILERLDNLDWSFIIDLLEEFSSSKTNNYSNKIVSNLLNQIINELKFNNESELKSILRNLNQLNIIHQLIFDLWGISETEYYAIINS